MGTEATGFGCSLISLITVSPQQDNALVLAAMREGGGQGGETLVVITLLPQTFMEHIACSRDSQGWGYKAAGATRLQSSEGNRQTHGFQYSRVGSLRKIVMVIANIYGGFRIYQACAGYFMWVISFTFHTNTMT